MRILFLISDTGGGHRAGALAVEAAMKRIDPSCVTSIRDALVDAGPWPVNHSPAIYNWGMKHARWVWGASFHLMNGPRRARLMADVNWPLMKRRMVDLITTETPDIVVSVHPLLTRSVVRAIRATGRRLPFAIVVTDLVTGHATWYEKDADLVTVPTEAARSRAIACGCDPARVTVTGQPLHPDAGRAVGDREAARRAFGWNAPVVLCVGGGDGMGDLGGRVRALARAKIPARLVVVCGRNDALRRELTAETFPIPVDVHGFVGNLPEMMAAADVLVTKGGPGSIMEGCLAGLPVLIYDYLPGQEFGNIGLVRDAGIGDYVPSASALPGAVLRWLNDPAARAAVSTKARSLATPDSATRIARAVFATAEMVR